MTSPEYVTVNGALYRLVQPPARFLTCPRCRGDKLVDDEGGENFYDRQGCLPCNFWFTDKVLRP